MAEAPAPPSRRVELLWGERLRKRRSNLGYTQTTFAQKVGHTQTTISRYERGEAPWTPEAMLTFAVALDTPVSDLFPWPMGVEDMERFRIGQVA